MHRPPLGNPSPLGFFFALSFLVLLFPLLIKPGSVEPFANVKIEEGPGLFNAFTPRGDIRRFAGETLYFNISFLWFKNAATSSISFMEKDGKFYSVLKAQTKGFVGWFTNYRKHVYTAYFDIVDNGKRVRAYRFKRMVIIDDDVDQSDHHMDYAAGTHSWVESNNGKLTEKRTEKIPKGIIYDDILSAFYNFRNSVYGKLEKGSNYKLFTIPDKGHDTIYIQIKSEREKEAARRAEGRKNKADLLLNAIIPKEIFKTKNGQLLFWTSKHYIPIETTVKDYALFGDLHAKFSRRTYNGSSWNSKSSALGKLALP